MTRFWVLFVLVSLAAARAEDPPATAPEEEKPKEVVLAIIVNPKNPVTRVSFGQLRSYLKVETQFWPNKKLCDVYLPQTRTDAYRILLEKVYRMSHKKLQKFWVQRLFAGQIPAKPVHVASSEAAGSRVLKSEGGLSIVPLDEVPKKVKVLLIDGKKPGEEGYPLVGIVEPKAPDS